MQAILNFSMSVLAARMTRVIVAYGLDPVFGYLHDGRKPGRLSLVWDRVELHRTKLVKALFGFVDGRAFRKNDFRMIDKGIVRLAPGIMNEVAKLTLKTISLKDMMKTVEWMIRQIGKACPDPVEEAEGANTITPAPARPHSHTRRAAFTLSRPRP
jgi:CRISPR/Cas system-associated endonuclease Cas1